MSKSSFSVSTSLDIRKLVGSILVLICAKALTSCKINCLANMASTDNRIIGKLIIFCSIITQKLKVSVMKSVILTSRETT